MYLEGHFDLQLLWATSDLTNEDERGVIFLEQFWKVLTTNYVLFQIGVPSFPNSVRIWIRPSFVDATF